MGKQRDVLVEVVGKSNQSEDGIDASIAVTKTGIRDMVQTKGAGDRHFLRNEIFQARTRFQQDFKRSSLGSS